MAQIRYTTKRTERLYDLSGRWFGGTWFSWPLILFGFTHGLHQGKVAFSIVLPLPRKVDGLSLNLVFSFFLSLVWWTFMVALGWLALDIFDGSFPSSRFLAQEKY
ncbi:hypothetical protein V2G26_013821 [Clonostachys chloroleuca]